MYSKGSRESTHSTMNTIVGLQASLHTSVECSMDFSKQTGMLRGEKEPDCNGDDFDPIDLFDAPVVFNDSANKFNASDDSFGSFALDDDGDEPGGIVRTIDNIATSGNFIPEKISTDGLIGPDRLLPSSAKSLTGNAEQSLFANTFESMTKQETFDQQQRTYNASSSTSSPPTIKQPIAPQGIPVVRQSPNRTVSYNSIQTTNSHAMNLSGVDYRRQFMSQQLGNMRSSGNGPGLSQSMHTPYTRNLLSVSPGLDSLSSSTHGDSICGGSLHDNSFHGSSLHGVMPNTNVSILNMREHISGHSMQASAMNGMSMQPNQFLHNMGCPPGQQPGFHMQQLPTQNSTMTHNLLPQQAHSGMHASSNFPMQGNLSTTLDMQPAQSQMMPGFDQTGFVHGTMNQTQPGFVQQQQQQQQQPAAINDAMEKLCESMKRSAMTRNLVKQISSGGELSRSNSMRGIMRQNSARASMMQQHGSARNLLEDNSGRGAAPVRKAPNAKHRLVHNGRGIYRHDSQQSLTSHSAHGGMNVQIDGCNIGRL